MKILRRITYNSPVILNFALASLIALLLGRVTGGWTTDTLFCVYHSPLTDPLTYLRMFTHILGHTNYDHYIGNMLLVLVIGPAMEEKYGSKSMVAAILITAGATGVLHWFLFPGSALLGASGIVFMLIVLSSLSGLRTGTIPLTLILVGAIYLGGEIVDGILLQDNVSQFGHVIGGICGGAIGFTFSKKGRNKP